MTVYSFYIFDRHAECIYQRRWDPPVGAPPITSRPSSRSDLVPNGEQPRRPPRARSKADDAKLIFGTVFSLRGIVRKLAGEDDEFISYRTDDYKLHYYETPTSTKLVMITDTKIASLRVVLHQIWANLYVEYVVRNPLSPVEHPGGVGVNNELFEMGLDRFVTQVFNPT